MPAANCPRRHTHVLAIPSLAILIANRSQENCARSLCSCEYRQRQLLEPKLDAGRGNERKNNIAVADDVLDPFLAQGLNNVESPAFLEFNPVESARMVLTFESLS